MDIKRCENKFIYGFVGSAAVVAPLWKGTLGQLGQVGIEFRIGLFGGAHTLAYSTHHVGVSTQYAHSSEQNLKHL
jgi:hypothetical protein